MFFCYTIYLNSERVGVKTIVYIAHVYEESYTLFHLHRGVVLRLDILLHSISQ